MIERIRGPPENLGSETSRALAQRAHEPFVAPLLEEIYPLPAAQLLRNLTVLKFEWDQKDHVLGLLVCRVQRVADLLLKVAPLVYRALREAHDDDVAAPHGLRDLLLPLLARQQVFLVELGGYPVGPQAVVKRAHRWLVARRVTKKHAQAGRGFLARAGLGLLNGNEEVAPLVRFSQRWHAVSTQTKNRPFLRPRRNLESLHAVREGLNVEDGARRELRGGDVCLGVEAIA